MKRKAHRSENILYVLPLSILAIISGCSPRRDLNGNAIVSSPNIVLRSVQAGNVNMDVGVDPRVELMSIIFHLAGNREYNECRVQKYNEDINKYFKPYENLSAIKYAAKLRGTRGMGYNAPMGLAVYVGHLPDLEELVPLDPRPVELDSRWQPAQAGKFLKEARLFAKESNFSKFYNDHKPMYEKAVSDLAQLIETQAHFEWFESFFGQEVKPHSCVILGLTNGSNSYGASVVIEGQKYIYSVPGVWQCGLLGNPEFYKGHIGAIHHELCHSYSNPIVYKYSDELRDAGQRMFSKLKDKMQSQAYADWQTMMCEYVVRVCTIQYYRKYESAGTADRIINYQIKSGFVGMRELDEVVSKYEHEREKYPTFESFFSRVIDFFNEYSRKLVSDEG
jgi:hypothetical protein